MRMVNIEVSVEVADWLLKAASVYSSDGALLVHDSRKYVALQAIQAAIAEDPYKQKSCLNCGVTLYVQGWGRPPRYCSDACRKAASRKRLGRN